MTAVRYWIAVLAAPLAPAGCAAPPPRGPQADVPPPPPMYIDSPVLKRRNLDTSNPVFEIDREDIKPQPPEPDGRQREEQRDPDHVP